MSREGLLPITRKNHDADIIYYLNLCMMYHVLKKEVEKCQD